MHGGFGNARVCGTAAYSPSIFFVPAFPDPTNGLKFPDLNSGRDSNTGKRGRGIREMFPTNLIMPEPCPFISTSLHIFLALLLPATNDGARKCRTSAALLGSEID
jgi:hypothetical protein